METINTILGELTYADLDQWAGEKIRTRGKSYIKRVEGLHRTPNDELVAWVSGTEEYATLVHLDAAGEHEWFCTCPYDWGPCKHAVAVILVAAQQVKQKQDIPLLAEDDDLYLVLFGEQDDETGWEEELEDEPTTGKPKKKKGEKPKLRKLLDAKSREDLLDLLVTLAADYPQVERDLLEAEQLRNGRIDPLIRSLRKEIKNLASEPAWQSHWDDEGSIPDYSHVRQQFKTLLTAGHADALLDLGDELWREGTYQVGHSDDEGETAGAIGECLDIVLQALPQSSLSPSEQLLWVIDRLQEDEFSLLESGEKVLKDPIYTQVHWRKVTAVLEEQMAATGKSQSPDSTGTYRRKSLMNRLIQAYKQSGCPEKILPLLEREADACQNYAQLVEALLAAGNRKQARQWCIRGFARTMKDAPGIASSLQKKLRHMAEEEQQSDLVAAYRAHDFFNAASLETYKELRKAAEKVGAWPTIRDTALRFLETGHRPDLPGKGGEATDWPLPEPEVMWPLEKEQRGYQRFPNHETLIDIAIAEKRFDEVVALYQALKKTGRVGWHTDPKVAKAVAKTHPEMALGIWRGIVDGLIAQVKPKLYIEAGGYLRLMHKVYEANKCLGDWQGLLAELRRTHKAKRRLMEVLDTLSNTSKKIIG